MFYVEDVDAAVIDISGANLAHRVHRLNRKSERGQGNASDQPTYLLLRRDETGREPHISNICLIVRIRTAQCATYAQV